MTVAARYESGEKFLRVIQLFQRLSDTEAGLTTKQLADALEVTTRSVQRYIATLRDSAGIDIDEVDGRWRIGRGSRLPAMQLDHFQATELLLAVRAMHQMRAEHDPALVGALAQLARALNVPVVTRYLEGMIAAAEQRPQNHDRRHVERALMEAFVRRRALEIDYRDAEGKPSRRVIHPYFLEPRAQSHTIYTVAWDEASRQVRAFRLERIARAHLLPSTFTVPDDFDIDAVLSSAWGIWLGGEEEEVVLRFDPAVQDRVHEAVIHPQAQLHDLPDGGVEMRVRVTSAVEMRSWVLGWGANVEVLQPDSLREHIARTAREMTARYPDAVTRSSSRRS